MKQSAMVEVMGAISYGEWKAYEGARAKAAAASGTARSAWRKVAAEELRHHKGFRARLERLGADPAEAMAPYRRALDSYHAQEVTDPIDAAVSDYLGEGIADDLLRWFRLLVDEDTAGFVDSVLADEADHERMAANELRSAFAEDPAARQRAGRAAGRMLIRMIGSGNGSYANFLAFLRLGRPLDLLGALVSGFVRRLHDIGIEPWARLPVPR